MYIYIYIYLCQTVKPLLTTDLDLLDLIYVVKKHFCAIDFVFVSFILELG